ncbi:hypothetical protein ACH5RR_023716 [Cinchona calisaya]|uniref:Ribulose bisphosphate carboxylase large chain n=1 Tax=Cinchona calisaya TaxID=153742 RepID=A0ABD2ZCJ3_9GENT
MIGRGALGPKGIDCSWVQIGRLNTSRQGTTKPTGEGFMSPQTETKASVGFKAGVKEYKLTYYTPEYETKDTDILAAFRVTPQPGVPPEEAGAPVLNALYKGLARNDFL